jgi:uncharacterized protein (DUF488 family)
MPALFTVGHSTRTAEELIGLLRENGIEALVDVRRYPGSRRFPQFSRDALAASLAAAGIVYRHEPDLGGRRAAKPGAPPSPHSAWRVEAFRAYADYMETPEFQAALERLIGLASGSTVAILCAEAVPWRCHRRLISDALVARSIPGMEVRHILGPRRTDRHELDANARIEPGGRLVYDGPAAPQGELFPVSRD